MNNKRGTGRNYIWLIAVVCVLLMGCGGPSTRVLPRKQTDGLSDGQVEAPALSEADIYYLGETLERLCAVPRGPQSVGAEGARRYLVQLLSDYGYLIDIDGSTVTARREAGQPDADLLILLANYGTSPGSPGAFDNASGTAVLLEVARLLAGHETDTELRFVFLPGPRDDMEAARRLVRTLGAADRIRLLGAVQIGPLGLAGGEGLCLGTEDGSSTFLGDQIRKAFEDGGNGTLAYVPGERTIQNVLLRGQIPVVYLSESRGIYEQGTPLDVAALVDVEAAARAADLLSRAVYWLMDLGTPSMQAKAHFDDEIADSAFVQGKEAALPFRQDRDSLEKVTGQAGLLCAENIDNEGRRIEVFRYPMKWFGVDQVVLTDYYYLDGALAEVRLDADGAGIDQEDAIERIESVYGGFTGFQNTPAGAMYEWTVSARRLHIQVIPESEGYLLRFREYDTGRVLMDGESLGADKLRRLVRELLPEEDLSQISLEVYSDGCGMTKGYLEPMTGADAPVQDQGSPSPPGVPGFTMGLDLYDALMPEGRWRDKPDTIFTILELYGQFLGYKAPDIYQTAFEERFMGAPGFAESFCWFVLADPPGEKAGSWGRRIRYFYGFEELVELRARVREKIRR